MPEDCIFCKIGAHEIPVKPVYEDDEFIAFDDLNPQAPVHALVIPKAHYPTMMDVEDAALLGRALQAAGAVASKLNLVDEGFRVVLNTGDNGGQTVYHIHFHVMGGRHMTWPPG